MSKPDRHPDNAPGEWYVDTRCINCTASRTVAPGLIVERDGQSVFARQPATDDERMMAWRARLLCPTASVRTEHPVPQPEGIFPQEMTKDVWRLGYNARTAYGAHSFLIQRRFGNVMVDAPRWAKAVVDQLAAWGGLSDILLTHQDDVGDAHLYAKRFGARVWIHEADRGSAPYADMILKGRDAIAIMPDILVIPVPGHTRGSVVYLYDRRCLFTGDSLSWNFEQSDLRAFRTYCWNWRELMHSLERLLDHRFEWVLPGHGGSHSLPPEEMHSRLKALVARMTVS